MSEFPDLLVEVHKQHSHFTDVKQLFQIHHLKYTMLFSIRLQVDFFKDPELALSM